MGDQAASGQPGEVVTGVQKLEQADAYELTVTEESLLRLHGLSVSLPLPCDLCPIGTVFDSLEEFDAHMIDHPEAKMFACQLCSNTYRSWSNLVAHRKTFHLGEVLSCEKCSSKKSHERLEGSVAFPVNGKPHGCEECLIGFDAISDVYGHYLWHRGPLGGVMRKGGNYGYGKKLPPDSLSNNQVVKVKKGGPVISKGKLISVSNNTRKVLISKIPGMRKSAISGLVVNKSNSLGGKLIVCQGGKVTAPISSDLNALKTSRLINQNVVRKLVAIPRGTVIKHLSGMNGGKFLLKTTLAKASDLSKNVHGGGSVKILEKPSEDNVGDKTRKLFSSTSEKASVTQCESSDVNLRGDACAIRVSAEGDTHVENQSSRANSVKTPAEDSSCINSSESERDHQGLVLRGIEAVRLDELLVMECKVDGKKCRAAGKLGGGLRLIAPKGDIPVVEVEDLSSIPGSGPAGHEIFTAGRGHVCPHCSFSCFRLDEYRKHLLRESEGHGCVMCSRNHLQGLSVTDHEYCQAKTYQFCCILCVAPMKSEEEFTQHLSEVHAQGYLPCCLCGKKFNWIRYLDHIKFCQQKFIQWDVRRQQFCPKCDLCNKVFQSNGALKRHKRSHDPSRRIMYDCTCGRLFQHKGAYSVHLLANPTHGPAEYRAKTPGLNARYMCEKCGKTFSKQEGLKGHLMRHAGLRPHACPNCPKSFVMRTSLIIHMRRHTGERPYMCEICGNGFTGPTSFYKHRQKHFAGDESGAVRKRQPVKSVTRKPIGVTRGDPTRYTCPVCSKTLSSKLIFEGHVRLHTGERPFVCSECGKGFVTAKILKFHRKRHENGRSVEKAEAVRWVHDVSRVGEKGLMDVEVSFNGNADNNCIFVCPRCGVGLVSPDELGEHLAKGDCPSGGAEMFVLPMTDESECIDTGSVVVVGHHE
ncbi:zinc finger protein 37 homolog [Ischnura elegans]|uniref:zinc finger protein 37 homolog n=1 Tax=Ischnura elegans TaxID=197161 RepID=UPI001ED86E5A|nr:zinc finger protein 37 homolog [Ischnura elegans]XP_046387217.1 zinc finger protein 37 homolog [Ischnura elegans]XP_046387218.1 zinc finger protein 37 homolog [Ischnura elegans]